MRKNDDEDQLAGIDLSAWEAPAAPEEIADAVLARMDGTDVSLTVQLDPREPPRRRVLVVAGAAAAALALGAGMYALVKSARHEMPASGAIVAAAPRSLSLDGIEATLDVGADVRWQRDHNSIRIVQRAGNIAWRVDDDTKLEIDAGSLALVAASGASLRVEVAMNAMDKRIIGASALTGVVAAATIVVYQGYVKVDDHEHIVIVHPGETHTVTVKPAPNLVGAAPTLRDPDRPTIADLRIPAGESAFVHIDEDNAPVQIEIDASAQCPEGSDLEVDGETISGSIIELRWERVTYAALCKNDPGIAAYGTLERVDDQYEARFERAPPVNTLQADGRRYHITFDGMIPTLEVHGSGDMLHVVRNGVERTYGTTTGVVTVPSSELAEGSYSLWFERGGVKDKVTTLIISLDTTSLIAQLSAPRPGQEWDQVVPFEGVAIAGATLTVAGSPVPVDAGGRFKGAAPAPPGRAFVLRVEHPIRGIHYLARRKPSKTPRIADSLDAAAISTAMRALTADVEACAKAHSFKGTLNVKVTVSSRGFAWIESTDQPKHAVSDCVGQVIRTRGRFPMTRSGGSFTFPFVLDGSPRCDAALLKSEAVAQISMGQHASALIKLEALLACRNDHSVVRLAMTESCASMSSAKAKFYAKLLTPAERAKLGKLCQRLNVAFEDPCDTNELKEKGMENVNLGQHAAALQWFEASYACKSDPYVAQLLFMEACASSNDVKAKKYHKLLTPAQEAKFDQMCIRTNTDFDESAAPRSDRGYLKIRCTPQAKIMIDGAETGLTTPVDSLALEPGKHKITFVIGDDRFTYPIAISPGKTQTLDRNLQ